MGRHSLQCMQSISTTACTMRPGRNAPSWCATILHLLGLLLTALVTMNTFLGAVSITNGLLPSRWSTPTRCAWPWLDSANDSSFRTVCKMYLLNFWVMTVFHWFSPAEPHLANSPVAKDYALLWGSLLAYFASKGPKMLFVPSQHWWTHTWPCHFPAPQTPACTPCPSMPNVSSHRWRWG